MSDLKVFEAISDKLNRATILECRSDGTKSGRISNWNHHQADGTVCFYWTHDGLGGDRATIFSPKSWEWTLVENVLTFTRTAEDEGSFDLPWRTADVYYVVMN